MSRSPESGHSTGRRHIPPVDLEALVRERISSPDLNLPDDIAEDSPAAAEDMVFSPLGPSALNVRASVKRSNSPSNDLQERRAAKRRRLEAEGIG